MLSGIASSLSGLMAAQTKLATSAHNVANANTDGFKKHRVVLEEASQGGVRATIEVPETSGPVVFKETTSGVNPVELSNVDLGEAMVDLLTTKRFFEANLGALEAQHQTLGSVLDILE